MHRSLLQAAGFYPSDLDLQKRAFDVLCAEDQCQPRSPEAEDIATRLVNLFESGRNTEAELLEGGRPRTQFRKVG
jgi:hypothetical protein